MLEPPIDPFMRRRHAERLELARRWFDRPWHEELLVRRRCTLKVLLVTDGYLLAPATAGQPESFSGLSFADEDFGLTDLIGLLTDPPIPYIGVQVTVGHRTVGLSDLRSGVGNPRVVRAIKGFRFDDPGHFAPGMYDEVWIFGFVRSRRQPDGRWSDALPASELAALARFMDGGGGVFATGDHEDLGCAIGGFVPRVRAMRQWFFPSPGPNGEPIAPPFEGPGRNDTNREGADPGYQFDDQSDDRPQPIEPVLYRARAGLFQDHVWPHPLLCSPDGPIRVLPDHPHESACTEAFELGRSFTFAGTTIEEFPPARDGGARPVPELVAISRVIGGHTTSGKSGTTTAKSFGAIGAYDGHRAGVGRVVVDATWHHFININLTGASGAAPGSVKSLGFLASPAGQAALAAIRHYFRNILQWLAPAAQIDCMRHAGMALVLAEHRLAEVFDPAVTVANARLVELVTLGRHARDALGRYASPCQSLEWTLRWTEPLLVDPWWRWPIDPWWPRPPKPDPDPAPWLELGWLGDAAVGGAMLALREAAPKIARAAPDEASKLASAAMDEGARRGLAVAGASLAEGAKAIRKLAGRLAG